MTLLEDWLRGEGRDIEDGRRAWVQVSMTPGMFLGVLEEGPHGHGRKTYYGKADTPERALCVAVAAWKGFQTKVPGHHGGRLLPDLGGGR